MSLRARMTAVVTVVTGVTLGGAFAIVSYVFNSLQLEQLDAELLVVARREATEAPAHGYRFGSRPGPSTPEVSPLTTYGVIYDEASTPVALTEPFDRDPPAFGSLPRKAGTPFDFAYHGKPFRGVVLPVSGAGGRTMLMATLRDDLDANEAFLDKAMLLTFVVAVAWAAFVASWVVKRLTSDHEAIAAVARRVAGGDLGARVPDSPRARDDELGQLGRDVNTMIETMGGLVRSQERFIAHAAHELRSPLAALQGELQQALRRERDAESYKRSIAASYQAAHRLRHLADDLLTLARITGERPGSSELASAGALAGEVARSLATLATESDVAIEIDDGAEVALVRGRLEDLERLLRNVIENAVRYSPRGGRVRVAVRAGGGKVAIEVSDEGPGVTGADRDKIFEPFYRAAGARGAAPEGTGLGLGIAREIARAHEGDVRVAEAAQGACFVIELPRATAGADEEPRSESAGGRLAESPLRYRLLPGLPPGAGACHSLPAMTSAGGPAEADERITIVYVEDDERLGRLTSQYLKAHGVEVFLVDRGDLAVAEVLRVRPDVVLLDLMLPGLGGLEICRQLRERVDVPVVMVTARNEEADRVMGLEGGADDYVSKPFSSRELLARVRAQARRAKGRSGPRSPRLEVGGLVVDASTMTATMGGKPLALTTFEFGLLRVLAERPGRVLGREQLLQLVHGTADEVFDRSIDVHVSRLRQKLGDDPRNPRFLKTVRGVGYMLTPGDP